MHIWNIDLGKKSALNVKIEKYHWSVSSVYLHLEWRQKYTHREREWEFDGKERRKRNYRPNGWCFWLEFGWLAKMPENRAHVLLHSMSTFLVFPQKTNLFRFGFVYCIFFLFCFVGIFILFFNLNYQNVLNASLS